MNDVAGKRPVAFVLVSVVCLIALLPVRTFVAEMQAGRVERVLDDERTEELDTLEISEGAIPRYLAAIELLESASAWDPGNAHHLHRRADLYARLSNWAEVMSSMGQPLWKVPADAKSAWAEEAERAFIAAIAVEPASPGHHLALARLSARRDPVAADRELQKALRLYPISSALRYEVAYQYLLARDYVKAADNARMLARNDDSYRLPEGSLRTLRQQRSLWYLGHLANSYLPKALEIAWRSGIRTREELAAMVPEEPEAQDVLSHFLESKGSH